MSGFALAAPRHDSRLPALIVAAAVHAGVLALLLLGPSQTPPLPIGSSVPINIVSSAPFTDTRPAVQAPQTEEAATPTPVPQAKLQPPAPEPAPTPAFTHVATPTPHPAKPVPTQPSTHPTQAAANPSLDWNRMQQIIDSAKRNAGAQASSAAKGPAKPETAQQTRPDAGQGISMSDQLGLQQLLERLWNPNCDAPGGSAVKLKVRFILGLSGRLVSADAGGLENSANPVMAAAARRALDAVREAEPYGQPYYGQTITVNFDAKEACSKR